MKKKVKLAVLSVGAAFVSAAAQAQLANGDLILGFTSQGAGVTGDYVVDLGGLPGSPNTTLNTSSFVQGDFNTTFGSALANGTLNVGIVGGVDSPTGYIYTSLVDNGTGTASTPGGTTAPLSVSKSDIAAAAGTLGSVQTGATTYANGFTANVAQDPNDPGTAANNFVGYEGANPLTTIPAGASSITLDIYQDTITGRTSTSGFQYDGDVVLNLTGSGLTATFDPVATPEPSAYALLAGGGLLAFALRRQLIRKNA
jgi:hypothetical protein